jgi:hypothetical protein
MAVGAWLARRPCRKPGGGALGIKQVREIVYAVGDLDGERVRWERLLEPLGARDDAVWHFADGPSVRLERALGPSGQRIVCEVGSLDAAARGLEALEALFESEGESVSIAPGVLAGVHISLVEGP